MSHHAATLQYPFKKTASALDFAYTAMDRLYWLDDNYVQPFYSNSKFKTLTEKPDILEAESMSPLRLPRWSHCH
jgi:hypothetical protein